MSADPETNSQILGAVSRALATVEQQSLKMCRKDQPRRVRLADRTQFLNRRNQLDHKTGPAVIWADGSTEWWRDGRRHRDDGPAIETADGKASWFQHGLLHRSDGPAYADRQGNEEWWRDGKLHRSDGPALSHSNGLRLWSINGFLHREDGPAAIRADGKLEYWFRGHQLVAEGGHSREVAGCKLWFSCGLITIVEEPDTTVMQDARPIGTQRSISKAVAQQRRTRTWQPKPGKRRRYKP